MIDLMQHFHFLRPQLLLGLVFWLFMGVTYQKQKPKSAWSKIIAPQLYQHLKINHNEGLNQNYPLIFLTILFLIIVAIAGPSWQKSIPEALDQKSDVVIILENRLSMLATDIVPTRLDRSKQKIEQLINQNPKSRFSIISYAQSAHQVTPLTNDSQFIKLFLDALNPMLMPRQSNQNIEPIQQAFMLTAQLLSQQKMTNSDQTQVMPAQSIIIFSDNLSDQELKIITQWQLKLPPIQVIAVGTATGGSIEQNQQINSYQQQLTSVNNYNALKTQMNVDHFNQLKKIAIPVLGLTNDNYDLHWLQQQLRFNIEKGYTDNKELHWKDNGYLLLWLLLPLILFWFRRGWPIYQWLLPILFLFPLLPIDQAQAAIKNSIAPSTAQEQNKIKANPKWWSFFLTNNQQAQLAFNQGGYNSTHYNQNNYLKAAMLFDDFYRQGLSFYYGQNYHQALIIWHKLYQQQVNNNVSADLRSETLLWMGNSYAQLKYWDEAYQYYQQALSLIDQQKNPDLYMKLTDNNQKITKILNQLNQLRKEREQQQTNQNRDDPDDMKQDKQGEKGKMALVDIENLSKNKNQSENWLNNLQISPAKLMQSRFLLESNTLNNKTIDERSHAQP